MVQDPVHQCLCDSKDIYITDCTQPTYHCYLQAFCIELLCGYPMDSVYPGPKVDIPDVVTFEDYDRLDEGVLCA